MNCWQKFIKRSFDIIMSLLGLAAVGWLIGLCWLVATIDTRRNGFFTQERVGKDMRVFRIIKIRTMREVAGITTVVTSRNDPRITFIGSWIRRLKFDELPQLINVLLGHMSFVGPRPDVAYFAELLQGDDRKIMSIRPGITGPASLAFIDEEVMLAESQHPEQYNREVIFPAKVKINRSYIENYRFYKDIIYILATIFPFVRRKLVLPPTPAILDKQNP
ncbi:sugar transferase [Kaarinaea lacus]